ncbi:hypothetical protein CHS0354_003298 [Potamilus streckersoni]|uniref:Hermansky-Pudlak syndrome 1 protein n=1 Tax=Potamilus streckersoni TaxID=2493646 RepID=A0AAE0VPR5_9BIVA|nr:hypothetical protein CHS0354_003298 [Potamilus streckersoni]
MKGFIVVDRMNDVHFIDTDADFSRHVNKQALDQGLLNEDDIDWSTIESNIIMQQFSPLIMSQWYMIDTAKNPCSSITCENGFLFVFKHFSDLLIIAINGDGSETEDFLTRKCLVFIRLIQFLFGPVSQEIGRPMFTSKPVRWDFLRRILTTWVDLVNKEQAFLMEAVERLHVNQMLNEQCIELLRMGVISIQAAGEKHTQHALLLVNSKLLALYSNYSAYELNAADILCIIILMRELFPTNEKLEDLFSHSYSNKGMSVTSKPVETKVTDRYESAHEGLTEGDDSDDHEQYLSAVESPGVVVKPRMKSSGSSTTSSSNNSPDRAGARTPYPEVSESYYSSREEPTPDEVKDLIEEELAGLQENVLPTSRRRSRTVSEVEALRSKEVRLDSGKPSYSGRGRSRSCLEPHAMREEGSCGEETTQKRPVSCQENKDQVSSEFPAAETGLIKQTVFLTTPVCTYAPYQLHCQRIFPGMVLVVLSEMPLINQASRLVQVLQLLKELLNGSKDAVNCSQGQMVYDIINSQLVKILFSLKHATGHMQKLRNDVKSKWDSEELKTQILSFLEQVAGTDVPSSLERSLKFLRNKILEIFVYLYLNPRPLSEAMEVTMGEIRARIAKKLSDYREYLIVKAQRNITMTSYIVEFPGLIHFIYINRRTNQITAPSLNITSDVDATQYLKDKIWSKVPWMLQKLYAGCISITAREGDFHYSYFLWFEDLSGEPKVIQKPYQPDKNTPLPGILVGNFYRSLIQKCFPNSVPGSVQCNELFMMHVGLAPGHYIASQCRQLAAALWDTTGEAFTPINLL